MLTPATILRTWQGQTLLPLWLGSGLGLFSMGALQRLERAWAPAPAVEHQAALAILCALSFGMWLPSRCARYLSRRVQQSTGAPATLGDDVLAEIELKTIGAACLVLSGLAIMAVAPLADILGTVQRRGLAVFHWTPLTLQAFEVALALVYVAVPMMLLGFAINCTQRLRLLGPARLLAVTAALALGFTIGLAVGHRASTGGIMFGTVSAAVVLLVTGLSQLSSKPTQFQVPAEVPELPSVSDHWQLALPWLLVAAGFACSAYIFTWQRLLLGGPVLQDAAVQFAGLSAGLLLAMRGSGTGPSALPNLAVLCVLTALVVTGVIIDAGSSPSGFVQPAWRHYLVAACPTVLMGWSIGALITATVQRNPLPASGILRALRALSHGAVFCCVGIVLELDNLLSMFQTLVVVALAWLALGGLLLIYEPGFGSRRRRPHAAFMLTTLLAMTLILPAQAGSWVVLARSAGVPAGKLITIAEPQAAARELCLVVNPPTSTPGANRKRPPRPMVLPASLPHRNRSLDQLWRELRVTKERYAAIVLALSTEHRPPAADPLRALLFEEAQRCLRPDGVLLTAFTPLPGTALHLDHWQEQAQNNFDQVRIVRLQQGSNTAAEPAWGLLACNTTPPADSTTPDPALAASLSNPLDNTTLAAP